MTVIACPLPVRGTQIYSSREHWSLPALGAQDVLLHKCCFWHSRRQIHNKQNEGLPEVLKRSDTQLATHYLRRSCTAMLEENRAWLKAVRLTLVFLGWLRSLGKYAY